LTFRARVGIVAAVALAAAGATLWVPPFAQDPAYHAFADRRAILGIPNFADVASNAAFLIVGLAGLAFLWSTRGRAVLAAPRERLPFVVFFAGLVLTALGSAYYHWAPTNETLVWDRVVLTAAAMALLAAFVADRIHGRIGVQIALPLLPALGIASALHWHFTEAAGLGDLRFYVLGQIYPVLLIPLICWLFRGRHTHGGYVLAMFLCYAAARLSELFDREIYGALGGLVGGHALKHLLAAAATAMVLAMLRAAARLAPGRVRTDVGRGR
jgi:hypothetical protein